MLFWGSRLVSSESRANRTLLHRGGRIIVHRECRQWQHNVALSGSIPFATSRQLRIGREVAENSVLNELAGSSPLRSAESGGGNYFALS